MWLKRVLLYVILLYYITVLMDRPEIESVLVKWRLFNLHFILFKIERFSIKALHTRTVLIQVEVQVAKSIHATRYRTDRITKVDFVLP